jgi:hypothetical protein
MKKEDDKAQESIADYNKKEEGGPVTIGTPEECCLHRQGVRTDRPRHGRLLSLEIDPGNAERSS